MANIPKNALRLLIELVKYYSQKAIGEGALSIITDGITELAGEDIGNKINNFVGQEENARKLLDVFHEADKCFIETSTDDLLKQTIISTPFSALPRLERIAINLPSNLDDSGLFSALRDQFENDWKTKLSEEQLNLAASLYRNCLDRALATKLDQLLPTIFRKVERIEKDVQQIRGAQSNLHQQLQRFEDFASSQSEILLQQVAGISDQIKIQSLELSLPDDVTLRPATFLQREKLVQEFQENLSSATCLSLVDGSGKGKTQLAVSLFELHKDSKIYWMTLRNKSDLYDKHLRIQTIRWLFQLTGESYYWQRYILGDITFREIVFALGESVGNGGLLIIDDLPDPVKAGSFYEDLEILVKVFSECGSKIVTTSQWDLPPYLMSRFPALVTTRSCPNFSLEEILDLLLIVQIPTTLRTEKIAALIAATTKGHPSLVAATLSWLEKQGKEFSFETFDHLLSGEPVKDTLEYSRKVLIRTLEESSKELLYRLSLIGEKFDQKLIFDIANVSPVIKNPGEQFDRLVGPWIDRLDKEYFDVSPLLSKVGENNVPAELVKKIHVLCADRYLHTHAINISDLHIILSHLWQAHDYTKFANVLVLALMTVKTQEQAKYIDWACSLLLDVTWPDELDIHWRIIIRSAQLRVMALAKGKYKRIVDDLELLLLEADAINDAHALLFAYMATGFFVDELSLNIVIPHSFKAMQLMRFFSVEEKEDFPESTMIQTPDMLWVNSTRIKDYDHIKLFLGEIDQLNKDVRELLYAAPLAVEASSRMMDQIWLSEVSKSQEEQDWTNVLSFIDQLGIMTCVQESECLRLAVARAKAVVYADYLKQTGHAIEILNALAEINNPDASFLINYSKGCFALDAGNASDSVGFLTAAENADGDSFSYYRLATTRQLAIAFEMQNEWENAKRCCLKAIRNFREYNDKLDGLEFCELLGELAYIHWADENPKKACGAMYGYVRELIKNEDVGNLRYKEVFNKAGHALGWFLSMARWGSPPPKTINGEEYAPVQPGLFVIRRTQIGEHVSPMGFANSHLLRQLALFAEGVDLMRIARDTLKLSLDRSTIENRDDAHSQIAYVELATLETILGNPYQALQYGLYARKFFISTSALGKESTQSDYLISFDEISRSAESGIEEYRKSEERLLYAIFVPLFNQLIGSNFGKTELLGELEKWNNEILAIKSNLLLVEDWIKLISYYKDLILFWKDDGEVDNEFMLFEHNTSFEIFRLLLGSEKSNLGLDDAYKSQVRVAISLPKYGEYAKYMFLGIGKFVHRYWLRIAQTRRFALHHPSMFLDELMAILPNNGANTLYEVLMSAGGAVGVNLPENVKIEMKKVKRMAKPWSQN